MQSFDTVLLGYHDKLRALEAGLAAAQVRQSAAAGLFIAALAAMLLCVSLSSAKRLLPAWSIAVPVPALVFSARRFAASRREASRASRLHHFYRAGVDRINGEWAGKGAAGTEFCPSWHVYARDLDLFGAGSIFELLCTARTQVGQRGLASYLLELPERQETIARQEAVRELRSRCDLRERICLLGEFSAQGCDWEPFREWLRTPPAAVPGFLRWLAALNSVSLALLVLIPWLTPVGSGAWTAVLPFLLPSAAMQVVLFLVLRRAVGPLAAQIRRVGLELRPLWQGLDLLSAQSFDSTKLHDLTERAKGAGESVRQLDRLVRGFYQCDKEWFYAISRALLVDAQFALAIERWKARHAKDLAVWLEVWGEFEALNAIACYAHEHPADIFPEIVDGAPEFVAEGLGHPLIPERMCVRNGVRLDAAHRFYLVSGSNMAGKSTFLRTIGVSAVLGAVGAPVRASRARQSAFAVCASVSIVDSLAGGKSKFMAEVDRLREILRSASGPRPVLFVIDEILAGTNSHDRRVAAESFVRALVAAGAVGALSTHDLALSEIAADGSLGGCVVHMESQDPADPFAFDYQVRPGLGTRSNALAIARLAGVAV